jgi:hypothetical protein
MGTSGFEKDPTGPIALLPDFLAWAGQSGVLHWPS